MSSFMTLPFSLLDNLSLNLEVIEWLGELAMNLLGSASTFQPGAGVADSHCHACLFTWVARALNSGCHVCGAISLPTKPFSQPLAGVFYSLL